MRGEAGRHVERVGAGGSGDVGPPADAGRSRRLLVLAHRERLVRHRAPAGGRRAGHPHRVRRVAVRARHRHRARAHRGGALRVAREPRRRGHGVAGAVVEDGREVGRVRVRRDRGAADAGGEERDAVLRSERPLGVEDLRRRQRRRVDRDERDRPIGLLGPVGVDAELAPRVRTAARGAAALDAVDAIQVRLVRAERPGGAHLVGRRGDPVSVLRDAGPAARVPGQPVGAGRRAREDALLVNAVVLCDVEQRVGARRQNADRKRDRRGGRAGHVRAPVERPQLGRGATGDDRGVPLAGDVRPLSGDGTEGLADVGRDQPRCVRGRHQVERDREGAPVAVEVGAPEHDRHVVGRDGRRGQRQRPERRRRDGRGADRERVRRRRRVDDEGARAGPEVEAAVVEVADQVHRQRRVVRRPDERRQQPAGQEHRVRAVHRRRQARVVRRDGDVAQRAERRRERGEAHEVAEELRRRPRADDVGQRGGRREGGVSRKVVAHQVGCGPREPGEGALDVREQRAAGGAGYRPRRDGRGGGEARRHRITYLPSG